MNCADGEAMKPITDTSDNGGSEGTVGGSTDGQQDGGERNST